MKQTYFESLNNKNAFDSSCCTTESCNIAEEAETTCTITWNCFTKINVLAQKNLNKERLFFKAKAKLKPRRTVSLFCPMCNPIREPERELPQLSNAFLPVSHSKFAVSIEEKEKNLSIYYLHLSKLS